MAKNPQLKEITGLLRDVSRSFYLTVRILPRAVRQQIGLAYLLARAADTIADTDAVEPDVRLCALEHLRDRILNPAGRMPEFERFVESVQHASASRRPARAKEGDGGADMGGFQSPTRSEILLLQRINEALVRLDGVSESDRGLIRKVLSTITSGQELDLRRFAGASQARIAALRTSAELDDYTYRVAGCVGEFWTKLCRARLFPKMAVDDAVFLENGIRFGKGLQLVNILRDLPRDLRLGRCYFPIEALKNVRLEPSDLLDAGNESRFRPVYIDCLDRAQENLRAGWNYTLTIPYRCVRLRLACAWPVLIGIRTLNKLRSGRILDPSSRIKIGRSEVRSIVFRSVFAYPIRGVWRRLFDWAATSSSKPIASESIFQ